MSSAIFPCKLCFKGPVQGHSDFSKFTKFFIISEHFDLSYVLQLLSMEAHSLQQASSVGGSCLGVSSHLDTFLQPHYAVNATIGFSCALCLFFLFVCVFVPCPQIELWKLPTDFQKNFPLKDYADSSILPKKEDSTGNCSAKKVEKSELDAMRQSIRPAVALVIFTFILIHCVWH